jgi:hypothetical protein
LITVALGRFLGRFRKHSPAMVDTPPSAQRIPNDPLTHARQFANEYADKLENYVEGRMHALALAEDQIGLPDPSRGLPWATFHPNGTTGGSIVGDNIAVNSGVLNSELLTERYGSDVGATWAKSRLRDRIDAVIAHELAESHSGTHEGAVALAADTNLAVSDGTRRILRAMAGRER